MAHLILLIGLPGSGKSYWVEQFVAQSPGKSVISTDRIRAQLFGDEAIQGPWHFIWRRLQSEFCHAARQINLGEVSVAIYDATNAARQQRRSAIALARANGFTNITGVQFDTPLEVCLERNCRRSRIVPEAVILRMHRRLQNAPPTFKEGFDQLLHQPPSSVRKLPSSQ